MAGDILYLEQLIGTVLSHKEYDGPAKLTMPNSRELDVRCHFSADLTIGMIQDPSTERPKFMLGVYWAIKGWLMTEPPTQFNDVTFWITDVIIMTLPSGFELSLYRYNTMLFSNTELDFDQTITRFGLILEYSGKDLTL